MLEALHTPSRRIARRISRCAFWGLISCLAISLYGLGAFAQEDDTASGVPKIYKWVDENGIAHYTTEVERIPKSIRDQIGRRGDGVPADMEPGAEPRPRSSRSSLSERGFSQDAKPEPVETEFDDGTEVSADASVLADLDERIATLEAEIAEDEELLKALISGGGENVEAGDEQVATLRDLSGRLPRALEELEALRAERAALSP